MVTNMTADTCCFAFTAECNACIARQSVSEYCQYHPSIEMCPEWLVESDDVLAQGSRARVDFWLSEAKVNEFGDEEGTAYVGGNPLFNQETGEELNIYEYIARQHFDAPWMTDNFERRDNDLHAIGSGVSNETEAACCFAYTATCQSCIENKTVSTYCSRNPSVRECPDWLAVSRDSIAANIRQKIDEWLAGESVNEFGDEVGTWYIGGNPLFDGNTGMALSIYEYVARQHPDAPWLEAGEVLQMPH